MFHLEIHRTLASLVFYHFLHHYLKNSTLRKLRSECFNHQSREAIFQHSLFVRKRRHFLKEALLYILRLERFGINFV